MWSVFEHWEKRYINLIYYYIVLFSHSDALHWRGGPHSQPPMCRAALRHCSWISLASLHNALPRMSLITPPLPFSCLLYWWLLITLILCYHICLLFCTYINVVVRLNSVSCIYDHSPSGQINYKHNKHNTTSLQYNNKVMTKNTTHLLCNNNTFKKLVV